MSLWKWQVGRQTGGYEKLLLAQSKHLRFDLYVLRLPCDSKVPEHLDPSVEGFEHHRVNLTIRRASQGGLTFVAIDKDSSWFENLPNRFYHFRPDLYRHLVSPVVKGEVWLLSFGWLRKIKK